MITRDALHDVASWSAHARLHDRCFISALIKLSGDAYAFGIAKSLLGRNRRPPHATHFWISTPTKTGPSS